MKKIFLCACAVCFCTATYAQKKAFQTDALNVSGYGQVIYKFNEFEGRGISSSTTNHSFNLARAVIIASGKLGVEKRLNYTLMYDFVPNSLLELYGEWGFSPAANVRFGQFKVPFTLENLMSGAKIETILNSRAVSAFKNGRDAGLQLAGGLFAKEDFNQLEYCTGVFNGIGINAKDTNNRKDVVVTAYWQPIKGLRIGGSVYFGDDNRWTAGVEYKGTKLHGRTEYVYSKFSGVERHGGYILLTCKLVPNQWEIVAKAENNNNQTLNDNGITDYTAGVNYYFDNLTRLQFNYIYTDDLLKGNNNAILTQLQLYF